MRAVYHALQVFSSAYTHSRRCSSYNKNVLNDETKVWIRMGHDNNVMSHITINIFHNYDDKLSVLKGYFLINTKL